MNLPLSPPLTILEEFLLLAHDERKSQFYPLARSTFDSATAGAVLMDLGLRHKIDNDSQHLFIVDTTPTNDELLDPVLQMMAQAPVLQPSPIVHWLRQITNEGEALREKAIQRLEARGILKRAEKKVLWVFTSEQYPVTHKTEINEVRQRLREIILGGVFPLPHDIMLTALAQACGLFHHIFDGGELTANMPRIEQVAHMDPIGQAVEKTAAEIESAMAMASGFR